MPCKKSDYRKDLQKKARKRYMQQQRDSDIREQEDLPAASDTSTVRAGVAAKRQRLDPSAISMPPQLVSPVSAAVGSKDVAGSDDDVSVSSSPSSLLHHAFPPSTTHQKSDSNRDASFDHKTTAAKKQLYADFTDPGHRGITEEFLQGKDIRQKKGRRTYLFLPIRNRKRKAKAYSTTSDQIRAEKAARYRKSPAFKSALYDTAAQRYKSLTQGHNKKYHRAAMNRAQRTIQRIRYHKSPRTHHRWLEKSRRREISPSRRPRINQTRRGSRVRSATVLAAYRHNEVLRARKHRKRAICLKFKRKYEDMRLQRITRHGRDRMQVGEQNFARWATLRLLRSYIAGVGAQGNPRSRFQFQKRHFFSRCMSNTLILRRNRIRHLIDMLDRLRDHWAEIEVKSKCSASRDSVLEEKYGGPRYHVASSEPYGFDRTTKQYGNLADIKEALRIDDMESEDPVSGQPVPGHHQPFPVSPQTVPMSTEAHAAQVLPVACGQAPSAVEPLPVSGPGSVGHQAMDAQPSSVSGQPVPDHHQPFHVSPQPVPMSTEAHTAQVLPVACGQAPLAAEPLPVSGPGSVGYHAMDAPQPSSVSGQPVSDQSQPVAVASQSVPPSTEAHTAQVLPVACGQAPSAAETLPVSGPSSVGHQAMDAQLCSVSSQPIPDHGQPVAPQPLPSETGAEMPVACGQAPSAAEPLPVSGPSSVGPQAMDVQPCSVSSQPISAHGEPVAPQPLPSETGAEKDDQCKNKGRICDEDCFVPDNWAQKLHEAIKKLTECGSYNDRLQNVMNFEICKGCRDSATNQLCLNLDLCQDNFRILRQMIAPHFSSARSLQRRLYRIRKAAMWILEYESVVCCGSWELFYQFIIQKTQLFKKSNGTTNNTEDSDRRLTTDNMEQQAEDQFGALGRTWQEKLRDFPINPCAVCLRLFENNKLIKGLKSDSRRLKKENFHQQLSQYVDTGNVQFPCDVCDRCLKDMNDGMLPRYSVLNDMGVDDLPEELSSLNYLGRMLLQRQKSFLSIFRMRPYRYRGPICNLTKAVRGCVVHLPMPKDTMPTTFAQLPSTHNVSILIDSLPTKQKIIWRDLIDIEQWKQAAEKIKEINPFYRDVVINPAVLEEEAPAESDPDALPDLMPANPLTRHQQADVESADTLLRRVPATETYQQFTVQSVNQKIPNVSDIDLFAMKKVTAEPVSESDVTRDMLSYPHLFPRGRFGMLVERQGNGKIHVGPADYIKARLSHKDPRFRRDIQCIFDMNQLKDLRGVESGMYATLNRRKPGENITAGQFLDQVESRNEHLEKNLFSMMSKVKGTKEHWSTVRGDFEAMDAALGPCTWFLTLSCNEYQSDDFREFLLARNQDIPDVNTITTSSLCVNDPVSVAIHFHRRFKLFMDEVLLKPNGPLGTVTHYCWRLEYQARGLPHIHMKLWVAGAPVHGVDNPEVVRAFIDTYVTCRLPDSEKDPLLHWLVTHVQKHSCGANCYRKAFSKFGKKGSVEFLTRCRAGFPRSQTVETVVNTLEESLKSRSSGRNVVKLYSLRRRASEAYINDYNPFILLRWGANMDLQYVGEVSRVLNFYISSYITKSEKSATDAVWAAVDKTKTDRGQMKSFAYKSFSTREVSGPEAAAKLLALPLYNTSETTLWLSVGMQSDRRRSLKKMKDIKEMTPGETEIFNDNWIDVYYPQRPDSLEDCCLHDAAAGFTIKRYSPHGDDREKNKDKPQLKNGKGCFVVKRNKCIVKYAKINPSASDANREKYFHNLLMLYKPWRDECELLGNFRSYEDSFLAIVNEPAFENMKAANRAREELENALKFAKEVEKKAEAERQQQIEDQDAEEAAMGGFNADAGITLGPAVPLEVDQLTLRENQLNEEQKQIYGKIVEAVQHRETEHRASNTACACADVCNLAFISGVGGTGKSHLIETIVAKVCHQFGNDSVAVAAPTGLASLNISGVTLHKLLKLPVQHGVDAEFWNLGKPDVKSMRNFFKNVRVFIIDEISMVSNVVLAYCHARFNELFGIDDTFLPFGGVMLIVFGDLLQLPPVRSQFVFEPLSRGVIRKIFGGVDAGANLWHEFRYFELLHNMRQRDDLEYAEMLGRARVGCSTPEDVEKFEGRLVYTDGAGKFVTKNMISSSDTTAYRLLTMEEAAIFLKQLVDKDSTGTLALVPKNEACDAINNTILKESFSELYPVMPAEYSMSGGKRQRKKRKKNKS